jgi:hypothetical protein
MAMDWIADDYIPGEPPHIRALAEAFVKAADEEM